MNNNAKEPALFDFMGQPDTLDDVDTAQPEPSTANRGNRADYTEAAIRDYFERNGCGRRGKRKR